MSREVLLAKVQAQLPLLPLFNALTTKKPIPKASAPAASGCLGGCAPHAAPRAAQALALTSTVLTAPDQGQPGLSGGKHRAGPAGTGKPNKEDGKGRHLPAPAAPDNKAPAGGRSPWGAAVWEGLFFVDVFIALSASAGPRCARFVHAVSMADQADANLPGFHYERLNHDSAIHFPHRPRRSGHL